MLKYHYRELLNRIIYIFICYIILLIIIFINIDRLIKYHIISNEISKEFIYTNLIEALITYIKLSNLITIILIIPIVILHIWLFLIPGLYIYERNNLKVKLIFIIVLYTIGIERSINFIIPLTYNFFISYENEYLRLEPKIEEYIELSMKIFLIVLSFIGITILLNIIRISIINLIKNRKYYLIISLIVSGVITPPDIINQLIITFIFLLLYEILIYKQIYVKQISTI